MNERIKESLMQAGIYDGREGLYWCGKEQLEKFAELIVKECANIAADQSAIRPEYRIRKHFGVEE